LATSTYWFNFERAAPSFQARLLNAKTSGAMLAAAIDVETGIALIVSAVVKTGQIPNGVVGPSFCWITESGAGDNCGSDRATCIRLNTLFLFVAGDRQIHTRTAHFTLISTRTASQHDIAAPPKPMKHSRERLVTRRDYCLVAQHVSSLGCTCAQKLKTLS
jgi:hypothetical protein